MLSISLNSLLPMLERVSLPQGTPENSRELNLETPPQVQLLRFVLNRFDEEWSAFQYFQWHMLHSI